MITQIPCPGSASRCTRCGMQRDAAVHLPDQGGRFNHTGHPYTDATVTVTFERHIIDDSEPADLSYLTDKNRYKGVSAEEAAKYRAYDRARLAAYNRGEWHMLGIRAVAKIEIHRPGYIVHYEMESPGLWGIESDSEESDFNEVFREECDVLKADIEAIVAGPVTWPDKET